MVHLTHRYTLNPKITQSDPNFNDLILTVYFSLIDQIVAFQPAHSITARKRLVPEASYLRDHFPGFPVMPGVLMLEATYQAATWLLIHLHQFERPAARLQEARNIKYGSFMRPHDILMITAQLVKHDDTTSHFRVSGTVGDKTAISGRLLLNNCSEPCSPAETAANLNQRQQQLRETFQNLYNPSDGAELPA